MVALLERVKTLEETVRQAANRSRRSEEASPAAPAEHQNGARCENETFLPEFRHLK